MRQLSIILAMSIALLAGSACAEISEVEQIDALCSELFPSDEPGAAVLVLRGDEVIFDRGYGLADLQTGAPIDGDTFFNIASVSKQFTAVAVLQLQEQGLLSVDDEVRQYFPEYVNPVWNGIKISHLLSHSSGIPDGRGYLTREQKVAGDDVLAVEYLQWLDSLNFAPGTAYEYINPTFTLMGHLIERVSGEEFESYMREHIFGPAAMEHTLYFAPDREIPSMAHGYEMDDATGQWYEYDYGEETFFATRPDGGIYTSTHEFVQWEKWLRAHPQTEAWEPHTVVSGSQYSDYQNRPDTWYGYGWFLEPNVIYHTGDNGGFMILAARYPESDTLVLIFANRSDWDRYGFKQKMEQILGL